MSMLRWFILAVVLALAVLASHLLARVGEPQSVWLWRDVLGVPL